MYEVRQKKKGHTCETWFALHVSVSQVPMCQMRHLLSTLHRIIHAEALRAREKPRAIRRTYRTERTARHSILSRRAKPYRKLNAELLRQERRDYRRRLEPSKVYPQGASGRSTARAGAVQV